MKANVYDLKSFYNCTDGRLLARLISAALMRFWPNVKDETVLGIGYAAPYMPIFSEENFTACIMLAGQGAHEWARTSSQRKNLSALVEESELPFETSSVDRVLLTHNLEYSEFLNSNLSEVWRVLKPNGRLLVVVPNRSGFWSRTEWSPFGQGRPFSKTQICSVLRENSFVYERSRQAVFVPPIRRHFIRRAADVLERFGFYIGLSGGVHIVEASKQIYAKIDRGTPSRVMVRGRKLFDAPAYQSVHNSNVAIDKNEL